MKKVFELDGYSVSFDNGVITSLKQNDKIVSADSDKFENIMVCAMLDMANHSLEQLITLVKNCNPKKDRKAKKVLLVLKDFFISTELTDAIKEALALSEKKRK